MHSNKKLWDLQIHILQLRATVTRHQLAWNVARNDKERLTHERIIWNAQGRIAQATEQEETLTRYLEQQGR